LHPAPQPPPVPQPEVVSTHQVPPVPVMVTVAEAVLSSQPSLPPLDVIVTVKLPQLAAPVVTVTSLPASLTVQPTLSQLPDTSHSVSGHAGLIVPYQVLPAATLPAPVSVTCSQQASHSVTIISLHAEQPKAPCQHSVST